MSTRSSRGSRTTGCSTSSCGMGVLGAIAFWCVLAAGILSACRLLRSRDRETRAVRRDRRGLPAGRLRRSRATRTRASSSSGSRSSSATMLGLAAGGAPPRGRRAARRWTRERVAIIPGCRCGADAVPEDAGGRWRAAAVRDPDARTTSPTTCSCHVPSFALRRLWYTRVLGVRMAVRRGHPPRLLHLVLRPGPGAARRARARAHSRINRDCSPRRPRRACMIGDERQRLARGHDPDRRAPRRRSRLFRVENCAAW